LQNVIERAVILSRGSALHIDAAEFRVARQETALKNHAQENGDRPPITGTLADAEREHILAVLRETGWVLSGPNGAAVKLAMKRTTLQSKMKKLGISRPT
jgi:formate hydrogenlyase transcriptional activator